MKRGEKMVIPDYRNFKKPPLFKIEHSFKGSEWKDHKYIARRDGTYFYPDSYKGGRHLPEKYEDVASGKKSINNLINKGNSTKPKALIKKGEKEKTELSSKDVEKLAREVIQGKYGNGEERKKLLGDNYEKIQKKVNEIWYSTYGKKKISSVNKTSAIKTAQLAASKAEKASKKAISLHKAYKKANKK